MAPNQDTIDVHAVGTAEGIDDSLCPDLVAADELSERLSIQSKVQVSVLVVLQQPPRTLELPYAAQQCRQHQWEGSNTSEPSSQIFMRSNAGASGDGLDAVVPICFGSERSLVQSVQPSVYFKYTLFRKFMLRMIHQFGYRYAYQRILAHF